MSNVPPILPQPNPPPNPYEPPRTNAPVVPMSESDERTWALYCHLASYAMYVIPAVGLANILGPLIVWHIKKGESEFVDDQGKESVNFQLSMTIYSLLLSPLCLIGLPAIFITWLASIIMPIVAGMAAQKGERYRYPLTLRIVT
jgi:uncharacterized protein